MTQLLVSVRDAGEARDAIAGGADVIDAKEPLDGSLGACTDKAVSEILAVVGAYRPVSVARGELIDQLDGHSAPPHGVGIAKVGLAGCGSRDSWRDELVSLWQHWQRESPAVEAVAVAYADWREANSPEPAEVISVGAQFGCRYFLLDTKTKQRALLDRVGFAELNGWLGDAANNGMQTVLAGSLQGAQLPVVLKQYRPSIVAVRGAACEGDRTGRICKAKVEALVKRIREIDAMVPSH